MFGYNLATRHRLSVHRQSAGSRPPHRSRSQARRASWVAADPSRAGARVTSCSSLTPCLTPCLTRLRVAGADNLVSVRVVTARDTRGAGPDILPEIRKKNRQFINKIAEALVYFFTVWLLICSERLSPAIYPPCSSCSSHGLCSLVGITAPGSSYALLCSQCYTIFVMMLHNRGAGSTYYFCYSGSKMRGWVTCAALVLHGEAGGGTPLLLRPVVPAPGSRQRNYQARYLPLGTNGSITKIQFIRALTWVSSCFDNHIDQVS